MGAILDGRLATSQFVAVSFASFGRNLNHVTVILFPSLHRPGDWGDVGLTFRSASFQQLFHTRKTASDGTRTSHTGAVLGVKRQLRARFPE